MNKKNGLFSAKIFLEGRPVHLIKASSFDDLQRKIRKHGREKFL